MITLIFCLFSLMIPLSSYGSESPKNFDEWFQELNSDLHTIYQHSAEYAWNLR